MIKYIFSHVKIMFLALMTFVYHSKQILKAAHFTCPLDRNLNANLFEIRNESSLKSIKRKKSV